jgi:hypothetical protein
MDVQASIPHSRLERSARWSAILASVCAVHCVAAPFLAAALPILAVSESSEWWALALTVVVGGAVTLMGPARSHAPVLGLLGVGAAIWAASLLGVFEPLPERLTSPVGSLVFAGGMLWSARICRVDDCERCAPLSHDGG